MNDAQDNWKYRRRVVFTTLVFIASIMVWLLWRQPTSDISAKIADGLITMATVTLVAYLGGPIADDYLRRRTATYPAMGRSLPRPDNPDG